MTKLLVIRDKSPTFKWPFPCNFQPDPSSPTQFREMKWTVGINSRTAVIIVRYPWKFFNLPGDSSCQRRRLFKWYSVWRCSFFFPFLEQLGRAITRTDGPCIWQRVGHAKKAAHSRGGRASARLNAIYIRRPRCCRIYYLSICDALSRTRLIGVESFLNPSGSPVRL